MSEDVTRCSIIRFAKEKGINLSSSQVDAIENLCKGDEKCIVNAIQKLVRKAEAHKKSESAEIKSSLELEQDNISFEKEECTTEFNMDESIAFRR